jgi:hypothetical protein
VPRGQSDPIPLPRSRWRVTIEVASPPDAGQLDRDSLRLLVQALRGHDAAGLIAAGRSCGAKLTVHARDLEGALGAALEAWRTAARDIGLVHWRVVRCEAVRDPRPTPGGWMGPTRPAGPMSLTGPAGSIGPMGSIGEQRGSDRSDEGRQRLA